MANYAKLTICVHVFRAPAIRFIICAQGLRLGLYKGLHTHLQGLYKRLHAGVGPGSCALRVELAKMLNVP